MYIAILRAIKAIEYCLVVLHREYRTTAMLGWDQQLKSIKVYQGLQTLLNTTKN
jgi:hypothetical protein